MFSCCFFIMLVTITDGNSNAYQKSGFFGERILKRCGGKKRSELGRYDCLFIFSNSGFPVKLLIDVCFAYKDIRL